MKKLLLVAAAAAAVYFAWNRFGPTKAPAAAGSADTVPAANAQNRINALSGAAPE
jgi:hypothetical protein